MDCVFCRILKGGIEAQKVFEDGQTVAFLDIHPVAWGHVLVVPREHHETLEALPPEGAAALMTSVRTVAKAAVAAAGAAGCNIFMNNGRCSGQAIPHAHVHVVPRKEGDGVKFNWTTKEASREDLERCAEKVRKAFGS